MIGLLKELNLFNQNKSLKQSKSITKSKRMKLSFLSKQQNQRNQNEETEKTDDDIINEIQSIEITRDEFDQYLKQKGIMIEIEKQLNQSLKEMKLSRRQINHCLLVGKGSLLPTIHQIFHSYFPK